MERHLTNIKSWALVAVLSVLIFFGIGSTTSTGSTRTSNKATTTEVNSTTNFKQKRTLLLLSNTIEQSVAFTENFFLTRLIVYRTHINISQQRSFTHLLAPITKSGFHHKAPAGKEGPTLL